MLCQPSGFGRTVEGDALLQRKGCGCKRFPCATSKCMNLRCSPLHPFPCVKLIKVTLLFGTSLSLRAY